MYKSVVLIVDDDPGQLDMVEETLKDEFAVSSAQSGAEALALLANGFAPDIILLDIDMPGMNGYETFVRIRENPDARNVPVLFLTGLTETEDELHGLNLGAMDYIKKPFVRNILRARIRIYLDTGRRLRERYELDEEKLRRLPKPLTGTEMKVARLLAKGYSNEQIVKELMYSMDYVKKLVARVLGKLNIPYRGGIFNFLK